jgi:hypothetical protein
MRLFREDLLTAGWLAFVLCSPSGMARAEAPAKTAPDKTQTTADADTTMKLQGGEEGTIFKSLRVEGEDRVRIEFERPPLELSVDPRTAPGLDWESFIAVLNRSGVNLFSPYLAQTAVTRPPRFAWPWFDRFATGPVARFRPSIEGVEKWRLVVANSHGETVATFEGNGKPPKEIAWNGRSLDGKPVPPGLTYSYVLEAFDRAGNKRNFVGDGFDIPPYIVQAPGGIELLFAGSELRGAAPLEGALPPILFEAASWINQTPTTDQPVRVEVTARSFEDAKGMADEIVRQLQRVVLGDPVRIQPMTLVEPDAPDAGTVAIVVAAKGK